MSQFPDVVIRLSLKGEEGNPRLCAKVAYVSHSLYEPVYPSSICNADYQLHFTLTLLCNPLIGVKFETSSFHKCSCRTFHWGLLTSSITMSINTCLQLLVLF